MKGIVLSNYAHISCITFDHTIYVTSLGSGNEFSDVPRPYDMKISLWCPENEEDGSMNWSRHQHCHLCSPRKRCSHIPWYSPYPEFRHHKEAVGLDDVQVIHRTPVLSTCDGVTFYWRWLMPRTTSLSREVEELWRSANTRDGDLLISVVCWVCCSFLCYPCNLEQLFYAVQNANNRGFCPWYQIKHTQA